MSSGIDHKKGNELLAKIALFLLIFAVGAFALKVIVEPERLVRYTPLVILHGATMVAWMLLFASQARLAAAGKLPTHRTFGRWSPILVLAMVVSGMTVSWNLVREFGAYQVFIANIGNFATFVPLYIAAIFFARRHEQAEHRQAMLIGTLALMGPAYGRVFDALDLPEFGAITFVIGFTLGLPIWLDRASRGSVSKSTWAMIGFYFAVLAATVAGFAMVAPPPQ